MKGLSVAVIVLSFVAPFLMLTAVEVWLAALGEGGIRVISAGSVLSVCMLSTPVLWVVSAVLYVGDRIVVSGHTS